MMPDIRLIVSFGQDKLDNRCCSVEYEFLISQSPTATVDAYPTTLITTWVSPSDRNEQILWITKTVDVVLSALFESSMGSFPSPDLTSSSSSPSESYLLFCAVTLMKGSTAANMVIFRLKRPVIQSQTFSSRSPPPEIKIEGVSTGMCMADTYLVCAEYKRDHAGKVESPYFL